MPQKYGAGTVYAGGPGSSQRGPLYVTGPPNATSPTASGNNRTFYQITDNVGNPVQPSTGTVWKEATIAIPNAAVKTLHSAPFLLVAAPGSGLFLDPDTIILDYLFLTAAFTSGGAISVAYGAAGTVAASTTVAATFLTSPAANQISKLSANNSAVNQLSSALMNTGLYLAAATADFATGSGSLIVNISYRVVSGLS